jgi:hypothetical protein
VNDPLKYCLFERLVARSLIGKALWMIACLSLFSTAHAQAIDPYRRLTDPRAITDLSGPDCQPLRHSAGYGSPGVEDSLTHYQVLASDVGAGIITHLWLTAGLEDSLTDLRIYIDGSLIISSRVYDLFGLHVGILRPPFDSTFPGGNVCDVQIPYRTSFKITFKTPGENYYYAMTWRPVADSNRITSFKLFPLSQQLREQQAAESQYHSTGSPWSNDTGTEIDISGGILGKDTSVLFDVLGHGLVQTIHFQPSTFDPAMLDSLIIQFNWDGRPTPAVESPVNDFFGAGTGAWVNGSHWLKVSPGDGYRSYFPMPFASHGRICLINLGSKTIPFTGSIRYDREAVDRNKQGYFCARFSESNPTRFGVPHPVLHERGMGHYVGMNWSIPNNPSPVALEGDPFINVDSSARNMIHYTGGEDYLNGGWWFFGATFTAPFSGFTHIFDSFYRLHVFDAIDFNSSIDYLLQHGVNNDVHDDYRTVAYYYKHWTPFWVDRDTIKGGEQLHIGGGDFTPGEPVTIKLGAIEISRVKANASGGIELVTSVSNSIPAGSYYLSVNGEVKPEPITVLAAPTIRLVADSLNITVRYGDSVTLTGAGFYPGQKMTIFFDSIPVSFGQTIIVGEDYRFYATISVPYLPDWKYHLVVIGDRSERAMLPQTITIVRYVDYEFEDLVPVAAHTDGELNYLNVSYYWYAKWSNQGYASFKPNTPKGNVLFKFFVPHSDTFNVDLRATIGKAFGKYSYSLDGRTIGIFNGYKTGLFGDPTNSDTLHAGVWFLTRDTHFVQWSCVGKDDSASNNWLGADNLLISPVTHLPLAPGTFIVPVKQVQLEPSGASTFKVYPDPCNSSALSIDIAIGRSDSQYAGATATVTILDVLGRSVGSKAFSGISDHATLKVDVPDLLPGAYFCRVRLSSARSELNKVVRFQRTR